MSILADRETGVLLTTFMITASLRTRGWRNQFGQFLYFPHAGIAANLAIIGWLETGIEQGIHGRQAGAAPANQEAQVAGGRGSASPPLAIVGRMRAASRSNMRSTVPPCGRVRGDSGTPLAEGRVIVEAQVDIRRFDEPSDSKASGLSPAIMNPTRQRRPGA